MISYDQKKLAKFIYNGLFSFLLFSGFFVAVQFLFYTVTPASYYFSYESVEPAQDSFEVGEDLWFISTSNFKRPVDVSWNDNLRCPAENGGAFFSLSIFEGEDVVTDKNLLVNDYQKESWRYGGKAPDHNDSCFLRSTITVNLPFGIKKTQVVVGDTFDIGNGFNKNLHPGHSNN